MMGVNSIGEKLKSQYCVSSLITRQMTNCAFPQFKSAEEIAWLLA